MKTVHKFLIAITGEQTVEMPINAEICHVGLDPNERPCLWAIVDPEESKRLFTIRIFGTGHKIEDDDLIFLGTFIKDPHVWHTFIAPI